jgi:hypothetical protein
MIMSTRSVDTIRRHVTIDFDLIVADVQAIQEIAHPAMRTYLDAFITTPAGRAAADPIPAGQPAESVGPDELHSIVAALTRSALEAGVEAFFPPIGTEVENLVVNDVALE